MDVQRRPLTAGAPCPMAEAQRDQCPLTVEVKLHLMVAVGVLAPAGEERDMFPHLVTVAEVAADTPAEGDAADTADRY